MNMTKPIRLGLAGLGGYAGHICDRILDAIRRPNLQLSLSPLVIQRWSDLCRVRELNRRGVKTLQTFDQLLASDIEAVWLPLPIDLHRPYTEAALASGKAVMCEKPAAGCVDDVDAMIAARDRAPASPHWLPGHLPTRGRHTETTIARRRIRQAAGFHRDRLLAAQRALLRPQRLGRPIQRDGRWVMDSPASNALAHFIHLAMFLLGPTPETAASPTHVAAELYRANRIENFDTCSLRLTLPGDTPLLAAYTHACATSVDPIVTIEMESAVIRYVAGRHVEIRRKDSGPAASSETIPLMPHPHAHMLRAFQHCIRESPEPAFCATLEMAREHVVALNVASETSPITDIPRELIDVLPGPDHAPLRAIRDIVPAMQACVTQRCMLSETSLAPWAVPATSKPIPRGYNHFAGPSSPRVSVTTHVAPPRRPATTVKQ